MTRLIMPFDEWPEIDRSDWEVARSAGDVLEPPGLAARWSFLTVKQDLKVYGLWLQYLCDHGCLIQDASPGERLTKANVNGFVEALSKRVSSKTTESRIRTLSRMIRVLDPDSDRSWLSVLAKRYGQRAKPTREKHSKMLHPSTIIKTVLVELDRERDLLPHRSRKQLTHYRNLLLIAFLTVLPIRLSNLAGLSLGHSIVKQGAAFEVRLSANETKNNHPFAAALPEQLTPHLEQYIAEVRPRLLSEARTDALWVSYRYGALAGQTIFIGIKDLTYDLFGIALNPHIFRDIAATYISTHQPEAVRSAAAVLGHRSLKTTQKHYNQANMLSALRQFQKGF